MRIPLDGITVFCAFFLSYWLRQRPDLLPFLNLTEADLLPMADFIWFSLQAAILVVLLFAWERMYSLKKSVRFRQELRRMILLTGAAFTVIILYFFVVGVHFFSRFILGLAFVLAILFMLLHRFLLRLFQHWLWRRGVSLRRIVFLGDGKVLRELDRMWRGALGLQLVGRLAAEKRSVPRGELKILGTYDDLEQVVKQYQIDEVVQVAHVKDAERVVEYCQLNYIEYRFVPDMLEVQRTNTEIDFVQDIPLITLRPTAIDWWARTVKRLMDILGASVGLILLSPVFALVAVALKLDDGGPVFYKSRRVSKNKEFGMWKFRSMVVNADRLKQQLANQNRREGPLFKIENDPRVTRVGRFIRRTTIDELPQLWNVLKGDLSLVGPRAHLPEEVERYEKHHRKVLAVKAGVTGLAQVSGRSKLDFEKEVKLDVYYLENWSFWLDLRIIVQTFGVLFQGEGGWGKRVL
ncbi:MAG: sugar transferase [Candidatus Gracilibacteria bacterium]|nr:sugar transferase [Candidatus Gracilibacteria bacterium]